MNIVSMPSTYCSLNYINALYVLQLRYFQRVSGLNNTFILPDSLHNAIDLSRINFVSSKISMFNLGENSDNLKPNEVFLSLKNSVNFCKDIKLSLNPQIVIDYFEPFSAIVAGNEIPRISLIEPSLFFSNDIQKDTYSVHSLQRQGMPHPLNWVLYEKSNSALSRRIVSFYREALLDNSINLFLEYGNAKTNLIPSIPSIHPITQNHQQCNPIYYTGPLFLEDNPSNELITQINSFIKFSKRRKIVYLKTDPSDALNVKYLFDLLLKMNFSILTNTVFKDKQSEYIFSNLTFPENYICEISDLVIHNCGSDVYFKSILNLKPSITYSTNNWDRDLLATRLQSLNLSKHIPFIADSHLLSEIFVGYLEDFQNETLSNNNNLMATKDEIINTMIEFDYINVLQYTLNG